MHLTKEWRNDIIEFLFLVAFGNYIRSYLSIFETLLVSVIGNDVPPVDEGPHFLPGFILDDFQSFKHPQDFTAIIFSVGQIVMCTLADTESII